MGLISSVAQWFAPQPTACCQLETISRKDNQSLITKDGSMVSVLAVRGNLRFYTDDFQRYLLNNIAEGLENIIKPSGFKIDFILDIDPDRSQEIAAKLCKPAKESAERLNLSISALQEEDENLLAEHSLPELQFIVVTTQIGSLERGDAQELNANLKSLASEMDRSDVSGKGNQSPWLESEQVYLQHKNLKDAIEYELSQYIFAEYMDGRKILREIKNLLYRDDHTKCFEPKLAIDNGQEVVTKNNALSEFFIGSPQLGEQIIEDAFDPAGAFGFKQFNGQYITALTRYSPASKISRFNSLAKLIGSETPYRIAYSLVSGSDKLRNDLSSKAMLTNFVVLGSPASRSIRDACESMVEYCDHDGVLINTFITVATWGDTLQIARSRSKTIAARLKQWAGEFVRLSDYPSEAFISTLPGFVNAPPGLGAPRPLDDAFQYAPITRSCSPWDRGTINYFTVEGKPWPFTYSDLQNYVLNVISGSMGSGKSVQLAQHVRLPWLLSGLTEYPLTGGVDYGPSAGYTAESIKAMLPQEHQHIVQSLDLRNRKEFAYNLLEPAFGFNCLTPPEVEIAVSFLARIVSGASIGLVHSHLNEALTSLVKMVFTMTLKGPRVVESGEDGVADIQRLVKMDDVKRHLKVESRLTYWNARDALFLAANNEELGRSTRISLYKASRRAHVLGAPLLSEIAALCGKSEAVAELGDLKMDHGGSLLDHISTTLTLALNRYSELLNSYPINDYSDIKMLVVNVKPIAESSSDAMKKAWFLLAKGMVTKHFWAHEDNVVYAADAFKAYATSRAKRFQALPKHYFQDEFEQGESEELIALLEKETLIARKYRQYITLATQNFGKLPPRILELATNTFVCDIPSPQAEKLIKDQYEISDNEMDGLKVYVGKKNALNGVGRGLLYVGATTLTTQKIVQPIVSILGPGNVWGLASDQEDVQLRERCLDMGSYDNVCVAMGKAIGYPNMKKTLKEEAEENGKSDEVVYQEFAEKVRKYVENSRTNA